MVSPVSTFSSYLPNNTSPLSPFMQALEANEWEHVQHAPETQSIPLDELCMAIKKVHKLGIRASGDQDFVSDILFDYISMDTILNNRIVYFDLAISIFDSSRMKTWLETQDSIDLVIHMISTPTQYGTDGIEQTAFDFLSTQPGQFALNALSRKITQCALKVHLISDLARVVGEYI